VGSDAWAGGWPEGARAAQPAVRTTAAAAITTAAGTTHRAWPERRVRPEATGGSGSCGVCPAMFTVAPCSGSPANIKRVALSSRTTAKRAYWLITGGLCAPPSSRDHAVAHPPGGLVGCRRQPCGTRPSMRQVIVRRYPDECQVTSGAHSPPHDAGPGSCRRRARLVCTFQPCGGVRPGRIRVHSRLRSPAHGPEKPPWLPALDRPAGQSRRRQPRGAPK
jgi:hypothetical protein